MECRRRKSNRTALAVHCSSSWSSNCETATMPSENIRTVSDEGSDSREADAVEPDKDWTKSEEVKAKRKCIFINVDTQDY